VKSALNKSDWHKLIMVLLATIVIGLVLFLLVLVLMRISRAVLQPAASAPPKIPQLAAKLPAIEPSLEPAAAVQPAKSLTEIDAAWLQDVYSEFGGMIYHREGAPRKVEIGGREWTRTNARAVVKVGGESYATRVYLAEDGNRRLAVFAVTPTGQKFDQWLVVAEERADGPSGSDNRLWIADGHRVVVQGYPASLSWFCLGLQDGQVTSELNPHERRLSDGALIPWKDEQPLSTAK